jgi:hypothetical protein
MERGEQLMPGEQPLRPSLAWFAQEMEMKLRKGDLNGKGRRGWLLVGLDQLQDRIREEFDELEHEMKSALNDNDADAVTMNNIIDECTDVANIAMMIADLAHAISRKDEPFEDL